MLLEWIKKIKKSSEKNKKAKERLKGRKKTESKYFLNKNKSPKAIKKKPIIIQWLKILKKVGPDFEKTGGKKLN